MSNITLRCNITIAYEHCNASVEELATRMKNSLKFLQQEGLITGNLDAELAEYTFEITQVNGEDSDG